MNLNVFPQAGSRLLTGLLFLTLAGSALAEIDPVVEVGTFDASGRLAPADEQGRYTYLVDFVEPSVMNRHRSRSDGPYQRSAPANVAWRSQLKSLQAQRVDQMSRALGRSVSPSHYFLELRNGIALNLTPDEARRIASLDGVQSIERDRLYDLDTFRGPDFIGAPGIWDGTSTPDGSALKGELMVAAILDSGIPPIPATHPSFANDTTNCSHGAGGVPDKVLSALDCTTTDADGLCNGADPVDENGHGTHVASTVAGNRVTNSATPSPDLPSGFDAVSGVAYCAHIRSYDVCNAPGAGGAPGGSCNGTQIQAGLESVIIHTDPVVIGSTPPVSVMNFSIGGGDSPWSDADRLMLDLVDAGVLPAASAGNGGPTPGDVGHLGPWVMSVAASTHDAIEAFTASLAGGPANVAAVEGTGPAMSTTYVGDLRYAGDVDAANFEGCSPFTANAFSGEAALISRGSCSFADKVNNAVDAGAEFVIVYNNIGGAPFIMGGLESTGVSSVMIDSDAGQAMISTLGGGTAEVTVDPTEQGLTDPSYGDILAEFSSRGPTSAPLQDLQKPDITAPGALIYAADLDRSTGQFGFGFKGGTSMSSPHIAGSALLVRQANPDWTPSEAKSAIQMTASRDGLKEDGITPWDWDDVGSGRVDLNDAALAGLVMDETVADYLAADPSSGGDVKALNTPGVRNVNCTPDCSFTRTLRNTLGVATNWNVTTESFNPDLDIQVTPSTFTFSGDTNDTVTLTIDVAPQADLTGAVEFGQILLDEDGGQAPQAHLTVAISGSDSLPAVAAVDEEALDIAVQEGESGTASFNISNIGVGSQVDDLTFTIEEAAPAAVVLGNDRDADPPQPITLSNDGFAGTVNRIGVGDQSFLWFNQLTPGPTDIPFTLEQVQRIEFPNGDDILQGDEYDIYIWSDPDRVPGNGDEVLLTQELGNVIGASPALVTITLSNPVEITADTGDVLIGIVNRTSRPDSFPANSERSAPYQDRAWIAFGFPGGAAGDPPDIANASSFGTLADINPAIAGNWVIRGLGTGGSACLTPSEVDWITVSPDNGTVAAGASEEIVVGVDSSSLAIGSYEARICVNTSDVNNPVFVLPVSLEVTDPGEVFTDRFEQ
jgi:hypothetical protein